MPAIGTKTVSKKLSTITILNLKEDAVLEDEAAYEHDGQTIMEIPSELVPEVRDLIAKNASTNI